MAIRNKNLHIYHQAAGFTGEKSAGVAYAKAQDVIHKKDCVPPLLPNQLSSGPGEMAA